MNDAAEDRISDLPKELVHHIHSFLHIKDSARTSVLSKRWNHIWTTVPILKFQNRRYTPTSSKTEKFMDFVDGTLHRHHSSNVDKFLLHCNDHLNESRLHSWISTVVRGGNVKELSLCLHQRNPLFIPLSLFTCESLVSLHLATCPTIRLPKYILFPRLKRLALREFEFSDECWNEKLFSNSPVLEELILQGCTYGMRNFQISIPTLKVLKIHNWRVEENGFQDCVFEIHAPRLVTFSYSGYVAKKFVFSSFPELVEADVCFNFQQNIGAKTIAQLLRAVAHVKCLTVGDRTIQAICSAHDLPNNLLTFGSVKMLTISSMVTTDQELIALLKAVPNLESLVFDEFINDEEEGSDENYNEDAYVPNLESLVFDEFIIDEEEGSDENYNDDADVDEADYIDHNDAEVGLSDSGECGSNSWALDRVTTAWLFLHLKSVCFMLFAGNPREMRWVELILRNAKALETVTIRYESNAPFVNAKSEKEVMVEIPSLPRASPGCVFKFYSPDWKSVIIH